MKYLLVLAGWIVVLASGVFAQIDAGREISGPIQLRNQFPLSLPFFGITAEGAFLLHKSELRLSFHYVHANTFIKSGDVVRQVRANQVRGTATRDAVEQIVRIRPDKDAFLFDSEIGRFSIRASYGLFAAVDVEAELPAIHFGGGILDRAIEHFHSTFGFPDDNRPVFARNTSETLLYIDKQLFFRNPGSLDGVGIGDLIFAGKVGLWDSKDGLSAFAIKASVKLPTGDYQNLRGSGSFDFGLNLIASKAFKRNYLHVNFGVVAPGEWKMLPALQLAPVYSALLSYERIIGRHTSIVVQDFMTTSIFRKATDAAIARDAHEITIGAKFGSPESFRWMISVTENHLNYNNTPDIGLHIGVERRL